MKQIMRLIWVGICLICAGTARADAPRGADVVEGSWMPQRRVEAQQNAQWREHVRAAQTVPTAPPRPELGPNDTRLDVQVVEPRRSVAPLAHRKAATRRLRANARLPRHPVVAGDNSGPDDLSRQLEAAREARQSEENARLRVSEESAREESQREANNRERNREESQREANSRERNREESQREENSRQRIREENQREENARLERRAEENRQQARREEAQREANRQEARRQEIRREEIRQEENRQQARREENRREEIRQEQAREEARRLQH